MFRKPYNNGRYCIEIKIHSLQIENTPRIRQIRDTVFGRRHKLNEYVYQFTDCS